MVAGKKNKRSNQNSMSSLLRGLAVEKEQTLCFSTLIQVIKLTAGSLGSSDIHNNWLKNLFFMTYIGLEKEKHLIHIKPSNRNVLIWKICYI